MQVASRAWKFKEFSHDLSQPVELQPSRKTRQASDLLNRAFISPVVNVAHTITDIDPEWFTIVEGRPILTKHSQSLYVQDLRNCLLTKLQASLREDEISRIEENFTMEANTIDSINNKFKAYVNSFEEMLSKDHLESMKLLKEADSMMRETALKDERFKHLSKELGQTNVRIYILEEQWRNLKVYQSFLYQTAPIGWRKEHDYIHKKDGELITEWQHTDDIYRNNQTGIQSLEGLIQSFLEEIETQEEPKLFFTNPMEIVQVLRELESQNLSSLLHSEDLATPLEQMQTIMSQTQAALNEEYALMKEMIQDMEESISWYEYQAAGLEKTTRSLLDTTFRNLVAEDEALILYCNVEDLYESVISLNDANLGIIPMMKALESHYEKLMLELDTISLEAVKAAEKEQYTEEARKMKQAFEAQKKVQLIDTLTRRLHKALEKPTHRIGRELRPRSPPPRRKGPRKQDNMTSLTAEDVEYLLFFTKWCWHDDPVDFGIKHKRLTMD